jgi:hypothetical protein
VRTIKVSFIKRHALRQRQGGSLVDRFAAKGAQRLHQYPPIVPRWIAKKRNYLITNQNEVPENNRTCPAYPISASGLNGPSLGIAGHSPTA